MPSESRVPSPESRVPSPESRVPSPESRVPSLASAYAYCERIAREHYENFPVASRLLPARMRPHIAAIYAFARRADDFADEPGLADADRLRLLDDWGCRLRGKNSEKDPTYGGQTLKTPTYGGGSCTMRSDPGR